METTKTAPTVTVLLSVDLGRISIGTRIAIRRKFKNRKILLWVSH